MDPKIPPYWEKTALHEWKSYAAIAAFSCAALALTAGLRLWWSWDFQYLDPSGVRGWVWANSYPKHQETAAYAISIASVAVGVLLSRPIWCSIAGALHRLLPIDVDGALRAGTLTLSAIGLGLPLLAGPVWPVVGPLWPPLGIVAVLALTTGIGDPAPPSSRTSQPHHTFLIAIVAPIAIYAFHYDQRLQIGILNLFEQGAMLAPLQASLSGGTVYRDAYLQHGLFHNLGKPLLASMFEVSFTSFWAVDALFRPLAYIALYVLGLSIFRSAWTALTLALLFCGAWMHISDRQSLGLFSVALMAFALRSEANETVPTRRFLMYLGASGGCTTLAFFYSTEIGLYSAAACGGFTLARALLARDVPIEFRFAPAIAYATGAALTSLPFLAYFAWHGVLLDFVSNIYIQCAHQSAAWGRPFDSLAEATSKWRSLAHFARSATFRAYLPPTVFVAAVGVVAFRLGRPGFWTSVSSQTLLLLTLAAATWFRSALGRFDPHHVAEGTHFLWTIVFLHAEYLLAAARKAIATRAMSPRTVLLIGAGALVVAIDAWALHRAHNIPTAIMIRATQVASGARLLSESGPVLDRLGSIERPPEMVDGIRALVGRIRELTPQGEVIFDFTNQGALYFLADRRSPSRYQQIIYSVTEEMDRELIERIEKTKPKLVVFESRGPFATYLSKIDGVPITDRHPQVADYLKRHYHFAEEVAGTKLYLRNDVP